jgi:hypothetical protein
MLHAHHMLTAWLLVLTGAEGSDLVIPFPVLLLILVVLGILVCIAVLLRWRR